MASRESSLTVSLIDNVTKPARTIEEALKQAEATAKEAAGAMEAGSNASDKLVQSMVKLGATKADIETVAAAFRDYTHALGVGSSDADKWSKEQLAAVRYWETETIGAVRRVIQERRDEATAIRNIAKEQNEQLRSDIAEQVAIVKKGYEDELAAQKAQADQLRRVMQAEQDDRIAVARESAKQEALAQKESQDAVIKEHKRAEDARADNRGVVNGVTSGVVGGMVAMTAITDIMEGASAAVKATAELAAARAHLAQVAQKDATEQPFVEKITEELAAKYPALTQKTLFDTYANLRENSIGDGSGGLVDKTKAEHNLRVAARAQVAALASGVELTPEDVKNLVKATDIAGRANDPVGLDKMFDSYLRYKQAGGELLTSNKILTAVTNAKAANFSMDDRYLYDVQFARATQMNPARLGSEEAMTLTSLAGGAVQKKTARWLESMGLVHGVTDTGGSTASYSDIVGKDLLETNQESWANGPLLKALEAHGVLSDVNVNARMDLLRKSDPGADDKTLRENAEHGLIADSMLGSGLRNTVIDNLSSLIANQRLIDRDIAGAGNATGLKAADSIGNNPIAALKELGGALLHFSEVAGGPLMGPAATALDKLAHAIQYLTSGLGMWKDPTTGKPFYLDGKGDESPAAEIMRGNSGPHPRNVVNTSEIDNAKAKLDSLSVSPSVDVRVNTGQLDSAQSKANALEDSLRRIGNLSFGPGATVSGPAPSLGSTMRGNFTSSGIHGE